MGSPRIRPPALFACSLLFLAACATARTNRFAEYGRAGSAYAEAVDELLAEAAAAAVDADSEVLIASREALEGSERARAVERHHALLEARLAVVERLRQHARALGAYFAAIAALAESEVADTAAASAERAAAAVAAIQSTFADDEDDGDAPESPPEVAPAAAIVLDQVRSAALERELRRRRASLDAWLAHQERLLGVLAKGLEADREVERAHRLRTEVVLPYASGRRLPSRWKRERAEILIGDPLPEALDQAAGSARRLREAFDALLAGGVEAADLPALSRDAERLAAAVGEGEER